MFHCDVVDVAKNKITLEKAQAFIESHKCGASLFLRGSAMNKKINILPGQDSYKISTLVKANCWVLLDQNKSLIKKGSNVKYINYEN